VFLETKSFGRQENTLTEAFMIDGLFSVFELRNENKLVIIFQKINGRGVILLLKKIAYQIGTDIQAMM
jgi:hypothetical protein